MIDLNAVHKLSKKAKINYFNTFLFSINRGKMMAFFLPQNRKSIIPEMICSFILCTIGFFFFQTITVSAYVDPSVMTYTIQAVAGVVIALGSIISIAWRKIRKRLEILDRNTGQTESDCLVFKDPVSCKEKVLNFTESDSVQKEKAYSISLKTGMIISAALSFMLTVYGPLEIYFNNSKEFWYDIYCLGPVTIKMFAAMFTAGIILCVLLKLLRHNVFEIAVSFVLSLYILLYLQGSFLVSKLPALNGQILEQRNYIGQNILSLLIFSGVIAFIFWFSHRFGKRGLDFLAKIISVFVTCVLILSLTFTCLGTNGLQRKSNYFVSKDNEYVFSEDENYIVVLFDALDGETLDEVLKENPEACDAMSGFTFYKNTVGGYPNTMYSIPFIFSGAWNENTEPFEVYSNKAFRDSVLLEKLEQKNYRIGMYETDLSLFQKEKLERYDNTAKQTNVVADLLGFSIQQMMLVGYKYTPYIFKPLFDVNFNKIISYQLPNEGSTAFTWENTIFNEETKNAEIKLISDKCFRYIHLQGAHVPYVYDRNVNVQKATDYKESVRCCVTLMCNYIKMLKNAGVYDNSTIIFLGDHGGDPKTEGGYAQCPGLLIKPKDKQNDFTTTLAAVSYAELAEEMAALADGKNLFDNKSDELVERRFLHYLFNHEDHIEEYVQTGYAWQDDTMQKTGKEFNR